MQPIDLVYPLNKQCSHWRNEEIRYSLRSVEKFVKNYRDIYIIGDKLQYLNDKIVHIQHNDDPAHGKERRIMEKFKFACSVDEISDKFVMMNDDYFFIKEVDVQNLPYYHKGELLYAINKQKGLYKHSLSNTYNVLTKRGLNSKHFDLHYPCVYDKKLFPEVMGQYDWSIKAGYVVKSLYCNTLGITGEYRGDCKLNHTHDKAEVNKKIEDFDMFSTADMTRAIINTIKEMYPNKSKYEN